MLSIAGAILAMLLKPKYRYAKYWAHLSISFFIVAVVASILGSVLSVIPIIGWLLSGLISLCLVIIWVIGIVMALQTVWWKPPVIYDIARSMGIDRI